jgi:tripartite-type tricarboxylate transporter receptor subunit TctC
MVGQAQAQAQEAYPTKPITVILGFAAGGAGDASVRWIGEFVRQKWKVPLIIENRPGAGATIAANQLARAKPDGYTLSLATSSPYTVAPHFQTVNYDPAKDFTYLFQFLVAAQPLMVRNESPHRNMQELIEWARANPGRLNWTTSATNGLPHIATEAALRHLGVKATYIPYKGGAEVLVALLGGHVDVIVAADFYGAMGKVRLLAESGPDKLTEFADVPTFKELGFPISAQVFYGFSGPAGMPRHVVEAWDQLAAEMVQTEGFREMVARLKAMPSYLPSKQFGDSVVEVYRTIGRMVPELGLRNP